MATPLIDRWVDASYRMQLHARANTASCRVADKAGFVLEAVQWESCLLAQGCVDDHQHVTVRDR